MSLTFKRVFLWRFFFAKKKWPNLIVCLLLFSITAIFPDSNRVSLIPTVIFSKSESFPSDVAKLFDNLMFPKFRTRTSLKQNFNTHKVKIIISFSLWRSWWWLTTLLLHTHIHAHSTHLEEQNTLYIYIYLLVICLGKITWGLKIAISSLIFLVFCRVCAAWTERISNEHNCRCVGGV